MNGGQFSMVNGIRLAYTLSGQGRGIVFLHGWMCNRNFWQAQHEQLVRRNCRSLILDFRGHGRSDVPTSGYSLDQLTRDTGEIIGALGLGSAIIVGHSMGGMVAQRFCLERPEQTAGLVLVTTIARDQEDRLISKRIQADASRMGFRAAFDRHFDSWFASGTQESVRDWIRTQMLSVPESVGLDLVSDYGRFDLTHRLGEIHRPTLVIGTRSDESTPAAQSGRLAELIPGARLVLIEDCGHFPMLERPGELNRVLLPFLQELSVTGEA